MGKVKKRQHNQSTNSNIAKLHDSVVRLSAAVNSVAIHVEALSELTGHSLPSVTAKAKEINERRVSESHQPATSSVDSGKEPQGQAGSEDTEEPNQIP